ncbi:MAG: DUF1761 domain-containing protein [SAR202 cluster bacterium]|nr:DUF1761 domain-containing protein [SAR202 cluster bacterium]
MGLNLGDVNWLAVIVATLVAFALGAAWYGVFAGPWMAAIGMNREQIRARSRENRYAYAVTAVAAFVGMVAVAVFVGAAGADSLVEGVIVGAVAGVGFVATSTAAHYVFAFRPMKLYLMDAGYHVVLFAIGGAIVGAWR